MEKGLPCMTMGFEVSTMRFMEPGRQRNPKHGYDGGGSYFANVCAKTLFFR